MRNTAVFHHPDIALHDAEAAHVVMETSRIATVADAVLKVPGITAKLAPLATDEQLLRNHDLRFIRGFAENSPKEKGQFFKIDNETIVNRHTWRAMQLSSGAACAAVNAVIDGEADNAFCPVYAGHHAQRDVAAGFCFINTVAVAAHHALARGLQKIAILDIDTHSGNGTILSFYGNRHVLFAETYQRGYPGPLPPKARPDCNRNVLRHLAGAPWQFWEGWTALLEQVGQFQPELILVSAGFDSHLGDPLGEMRLLDRDYTRIAKEILAINSRVVACLEGGYNVEATARCAALFVQEMVSA